MCDPVAERGPDRGLVWPKSIGRNLRRAQHALAQVGTMLAMAFDMAYGTDGKIDIKEEAAN